MKMTDGSLASRQLVGSWPSIEYSAILSSWSVMNVITDSPPTRPAGHNTDKVLAIAGPDDQ